MSDGGSGPHLAPEIFIDLLDGAPVEASHRLHVERCDACRQEIEGLTGTLSLLRSAEEGGVWEAARAEMPRPGPKGISLVLVAAAAILVAFVLIYPTSRPEWVEGPSPSAAEVETLLPPAEQDEAFQLLLALSEELADSDVLPGETADADVLPSQIDELTPEERGIVLERLAEEMRSTSS